MLLNLILDTNTWIYLSYGFDVRTNQIDEDLHFELIEKILDKIESHECQIYSNSIIRDEWEDNKEHTKTLIKKYEAQITDESNQLRKKRKSPDYGSHAKAFRKLESEIRAKIEKNLRHIKNVDKLIAGSHDIPIKDEHRIHSTRLAVKKKPPFHHKNNSVADALIFLSTIDYFFYDDEFPYDEFPQDNTIFISNNSSDFGESVKSEKLHPELAEMIKDKPIIFERNLGVALNLGESIISRYKDYLIYTNRDIISCMMYCNGQEYFRDEVEFDSQIKFKRSDFDYSFDPNQLLINFGKDYKYEQEDFINGLKNHLTICDFGTCDFCNTEHLRCECGQEHPIIEDKFQCECGNIFDFENRIILKST